MIICPNNLFSSSIYAAEIDNPDNTFYSYVINNQGCQINSWYSEEYQKYFLFMTNKDTLTDIDLHYLSDEVNPESGQYIEKIIENAFSASDEITIPDSSNGSIDIMIMQSNIPSLFIDLDEVTLSEIQANKDQTFGGNKLLLEAANEVYDLSVDNVEIKGRGNSSWVYFDKKGYQLKFDKKTSILGMKKAKKWCLLANASDDSLIKNYLALNLASNLGLDYAINGEFIDLWIEGDYQGTYLLTDKVEINNNRVALTDDLGVLFEWDKAFYKDEDYWFYNSKWNTYFTVKDSVNPDSTVIHSSMNLFDSSLNEFYNFITTTPLSSITLQDLEFYIDIKSFAIYYLVNEYLLNKESIHTSFYWYKDGNNDVLHVGPVWDFDTCMNFYGDDTTEDYHINKSSIFRQLLSIPAFYSYVEEMYNTNLSLFINIPNDVAIQADTLKDSASMNYLRWNYLGTENPKGGTYSTTYDEAIVKLQSWLYSRISTFYPKRQVAYTYTLDEAKENLTITVHLPDTPNSVSFAIWSNENGQDDLDWYEASNNEDGSFTSVISLYDFKHAGEFSLHLYADSICIDGSNFYIDNLPVLKKQLTTKVSNNYTTMTITLSNVDDYDNIYFPTWSATNGQDDIFWYKAHQKYNGTWECTVDLTKHNSTGAYFIHAYGEKDGEKIFLCNADAFVNSLPLLPALSTKVSSACSTMTITLSNAADYNNVYFPIWSAANGQDDIIWYNGTKDSNDNWTCTVDLTKHNSTGTYFIHAYGQKYGVQTLIANTTTFVEYIPTPSTITTQISPDYKTMKITLANAADYDNVYFPTWSAANGQDDIIWYKANKTSNDNWTCTVDLTKHNSTGTYFIHAYGQKYGTKTLIANANTFVEYIPASPIITTSLSANHEILTITLSNVDDYDDIYFPLWSIENGQDDIIWYQANKTQNNNWSCTVDLKKHGLNTCYSLHVYSNKSGTLSLITNKNINAL